MAAMTRAASATILGKRIFELRRRWESSEKDRAAYDSFSQENLRAGAGAWVSETFNRRVTAISQLQVDNRQANEAMPENRAIDAFFGKGKRLQIAPGLAHPNYPEYWQGYQWLERRLLQILPGSINSEYYATRNDELIFPDNRNSSIITVGGPFVSALSQIALQYEIIRNENGYDLHARQQPFFDLPFQYFAQSGRAKNRNLGLEILSEQTHEHNPPSWGIFDKSTGQSYLSADFEKGIFDYLLLTFVPNFLNVSAFDDEQKIMVAGGSHMIGTSAVYSVLESVDFPNLISQSVGNNAYWQALIPVVKVDRSNARFPFAAKIDLSKMKVKAIDLDYEELRSLSTSLSSDEVKRWYHIPTYSIFGNDQQRKRPAFNVSVQEPELRLVLLEEPKVRDHLAASTKASSGIQGVPAESDSHRSFTDASFDDTLSGQSSIRGRSSAPSEDWTRPDPRKLGRGQINRFHNPNNSIRPPHPESELMRRVKQGKIDLVKIAIEDQKAVAEQWGDEFGVAESPFHRPDEDQ